MLSLLLMAGLAMSPDIEPPPRYKARIEDHEVWVETADGEKRVVFDALAAEPAAVSPTGDRVVYAVDNPKTDEHCDNTPRQYIALVTHQGSPIWKVGLDNCNRFDQFEWIDDHRIGAKLCGHRNCFYWILDAASGKVQQRLTGGFDFLWSRNRRFVAHHMPFYNEEDGSVVSISSGERDVSYPKPDPKTGQFPVVDIERLTWSPDDSWLSFRLIEHPSFDSYVVLMSPDGKVLRDSLPVDADDAVIEWINVSQFQITASGKKFQYRVDGTGLHEISRQTE